MRKTGSSFKMKQSTKRVMMNILNQHERGEFKRMMIDAQLAEAAARQKSKFKSVDSERDV